MATFKTNISDLSNSSNGPNRLSVIKGGIGNAGTIGVGFLSGIGTNDLNLITFLPNGSYFRAAGAVTMTTQSPPQWSVSSSTTISAAVPLGYITTASSLATVILPTSFGTGAQIGITGLGSGGWKLEAGTGTTIQYGTQATSSGGSLSSTNQYDTIVVMGIVANTTWAVLRVTSSGLTVL
jgi:hypothetical protein